MKCSHFSWIVSHYDARGGGLMTNMHTHSKALGEVFLYWLQTICTRASALFTFWFRLPWYNPAIQNPKGKYFNTGSLQCLNCHATQMKVVGLICSHCALMQLWFGWSRTGYESIRQGWDHARGQGNQLVREARMAIFSFRFSFFFNVDDLWHQMRKVSPSQSPSSCYSA